MLIAGSARGLGHALFVGETATVTISFSEAVTDFTNADLSVTNGSLSAVSSADGGKTWTAIFTPTAGLVSATNVITLASTGVQDQAGNARSTTSSSAGYAVNTYVPVPTVDTAAPTIAPLISATTATVPAANFATDAVTPSNAVSFFTPGSNLANSSLSAPIDASAPVSPALGSGVTVTASVFAGASGSGGTSGGMLGGTSGASGTGGVFGGTSGARPESATPSPSQAPVLTQGGGFPVVVASGAQASAVDGLSVNRPLADQTIGAGTVGEFAIPADAFAHTRPDAVITLQARQANGQPLPAWVSFDAASGSFQMQAPPGFAGELAIRVSARDAQGREAVTTFKVKIGEPDRGNRAQPERPGRAGLSEQIRLAAHPHPALDRLARILGARA